MVVPWRAARVRHARVMPLATRWAQERQMVCGSGVKSTGAVKSSAPAGYWPIMKMRAAVTGTEQSALIWLSMADRAEPVACRRGRPGGAGGMRADGGEAVEVRKHEGLAEGPNEEDGRHGLRGCSEVGELVRMRSKRRRRGAVARRVVGGFQPLGSMPAWQTRRSRRHAGRWR